MVGVSRTGQLWRGELAQRIESYLRGEEDADTLVDWAMDHPFFDDRSELDPQDQRVLGQGLGLILQLSEAEDAASRTSRADLARVLPELWGTAGPSE